ncbi:lipopolysaccharide biosynthesis protein [Clostridium baratii]|uniref:lipopolysaccharide biosynthesis protein n=1 Tax=Clostridium baratii TaxID=1561 RepID=UPI0030D13C7B
MRNKILQCFNIFKKNKLVNNFAILLSGEGIISLISMLSLAIIIKAIGLELNGVILSIQTYCLLLNNIFAFKSFQALIKYVSVAIEEKKDDRTKSYILQSYVLDIISVVISVIVGFIFLNIYARFMGWDNSIIFYCKIYLLASLFQIQGTPIGILRTFNKFNYITYNNVFVSIIKLLLYIVGLFMGFGFGYFIIVEIINYILPNIILNVLSYKTLKYYNIEDFHSIKFKFDKEFFKFNFYSNISSTIDIPVGQLTTVLINKYLGFEQISIYKIFEKLSSIIGKLGSPLNQIIYPEMANKIAKKDYDSARKLNDKLMKYISLLGIVILIGVASTYRLWIWIFIKDYNAEIIISLLIYLAYVVFTNATSGVHSLFMALNFIKYNIPILLIINILYLGILFIMIKNMGLLGVIISLFLQAISVVVIKLIIMNKNNYLEKVY